MIPALLLKVLEKGVKDYFGKEKGRELFENIKKLYFKYCEENKNDPPQLKKHTEGMMFAGAALYNALIDEGKDKEEALKITDEIVSAIAESAASKIRTAAKISGVYKKVPSVFNKMLETKYNEEAGFELKFYDMQGEGIRFDVLKCPYYDNCKKLGCPEITKVFCHTDDISYGNLHPKLKWHRDFTIGRGDDHCDFEIRIEK